MKLKPLFLLIFIPILFLNINCSTYPSRPTQKALFSRCQGPITSTNTLKNTKKGISVSKGVLGLVAWGDSSIKSAMDNANCKIIHHVDYDHMYVHLPYLNIPLYEEFTTVVYGE